MHRSKKKKKKNSISNRFRPVINNLRDRPLGSTEEDDAARVFRVMSFLMRYRILPVPVVYFEYTQCDRNLIETD